MRDKKWGENPRRKRLGKSIIEWMLFWLKSLNWNLSVSSFLFSLFKWNSFHQLWKILPFISWFQWRRVITFTSLNCSISLSRWYFDFSVSVENTEWKWIVTILILLKRTEFYEKWSTKIIRWISKIVFCAIFLYEVPCKRWECSSESKTVVVKDDGKEVNEFPGEEMKRCSSSFSLISFCLSFSMMILCNQWHCSSTKMETEAKEKKGKEWQSVKQLLSKDSKEASKEQQLRRCSYWDSGNEGKMVIYFEIRGFFFVGILLEECLCTMLQESCWVSQKNLSTVTQSQ